MCSFLIYSKNLEIEDNLGQIWLIEYPGNTYCRTEILNFCQDQKSYQVKESANSLGVSAYKALALAVAL